jgi:hypothetical protein
MANFIISLDSSTHANAGAAELAITNAGLAITKTYSFPLTYGVSGTTSQVGALAGVSEYAENGTALTSTLDAFTEASADHEDGHLDTTAINPNYQYFWHPLDTTLGAGQTIYLIDTGFSGAHQEFGEDPDVSNLHSAPNATGFDDTDGHGSKMAGLIIGSAIGCASGASIQNVKMFNDNTTEFTAADVVDALEAILVHHTANDASVAKIVLMAWSMTKNALIDAKLNQMLAANLMVIASAGNAGNGVDVDTITPGGLDTITTVGAHDHVFEVTTFSQMPVIDYVDDDTTPFRRGLVQNAAKIDIFAVGKDVCTIDPDNVANYIPSNGTSVSAAMVAGIATHYMNLYASTSAETIKSYMVTRGNEMARLPRSTSTAEDYQTILSYTNLSYPAGKTAEYNKVSLSLLSCPMTSEVAFTNIPSGRLLNVAHGSTTTVDIGLHADVTDVAVLDFSPLAPWMAFDAATGIVTITATTAAGCAESLAPGVYHFAVKGTMATKVYVEEYSIGVYGTAESELTASTEYYYDDDESEYEEVIQYSASTQNFIK